VRERREEAVGQGQVGGPPAVVFPLLARLAAQPRAQPVLDAQEAPQALHEVVRDGTQSDAQHLSDPRPRGLTSRRLGRLHVLLRLRLSAPQRHVGLQDDGLVVAAGRHLNVEGLGAAVRQLAGDDDLGAVEVVGELVLGDVADGVLRVLDAYVGQQRSPDLVVEPGKERRVTPAE